MDSERLLVYVDLTRKKKKLKDDLKKLESELGRLESSVLRDMEASGLASTKLASGQTVYLRTDVIPSRAVGVDSDRLVSVLRENGLDFLTNDSYQFQRTQSWVKELRTAWEQEHSEPFLGELEDLLPAEIKGVLCVTDTTRVVVRGA